MDESKQRILKAAGYAVFAVAALLFFFYQTFPYDKATNYMIFKLVRQFPGLEIKIARTRPYMLTGLSQEGMTIATRKEDKKIRWVEVDRFRARLSLLSLIKGVVGASFKADLYGGSVSGMFDRSSEGDFSIRTIVDDINIERYLPLKTMVEARAAGKISGEIDVEIPGGKYSKTDGTLSLRLDGLKVSNIEGFGFVLPEVVTDEANAVLTLEKGKATVDTFTVESKDFEATADGEIFLNDQLPMSSLKLNAKIKLKGAFEEQYGSLMTMFKKKDPEGYFNLSIMGILSSPRPYFK